MKDLKTQLKAKYGIEDEERAKCGEAHFRSQMEHLKAEVKKLLQEYCNSKLHEYTSFNSVQIDLMLHHD
jgi:hypothetical protein